MEKKVRVIIEDIKKVKIQGARNIARAALYAYSLNPTREVKEKLIHARPTEPMLEHTIRKFEELGYKKTLAHFDEAQEDINKNVLKLIKNNSVIFTHCHSTNVVKALVYAKKKGKKFEVYNTETRPLYQGRLTAKELEKNNIKVTMFIDSALDLALKETDIIFLGADAIVKNGVINKIGSETIAKLAKIEKIPVYIIADSWKHSHNYVKIEQRKVNEIWNRAPKHIKIKNPAFELVEKKYIRGIVSELGVLNFEKFMKKVNS